MVSFSKSSQEGSSRNAVEEPTGRGDNDMSSQEGSSRNAVEEPSSGGESDIPTCHGWSSQCGEKSIAAQTRVKTLSHNKLTGGATTCTPRGKKCSIQLLVLCYATTVTAAWEIMTDSQARNFCKEAKTLLERRPHLWNSNTFSDVCPESEFNAVEFTDPVKELRGCYFSRQGRRAVWNTYIDIQGDKIKLNFGKKLTRGNQPGEVMLSANEQDVKLYEVSINKTDGKRLVLNVSQSDCTWLVIPFQVEGYTKCIGKFGLRFLSCKAKRKRPNLDKFTEIEYTKQTYLTDFLKSDMENAWKPTVTAGVPLTNSTQERPISSHPEQPRGGAADAGSNADHNAAQPQYRLCPRSTMESLRRLCPQGDLLSDGEGRHPQASQGITRERQPSE